MTDTKNLIEEAKAIGNWQRHVTGPAGNGVEGPTLFARVVFALEAAEQRADALAAVVEKVREATRYGSRMDAHPTRIPTGSVQDSEFWWASWHAQADEAWRRNMTDALATAPADALREHDARVWEEGRESVALDLTRPLGEDGRSPMTPNPYRREEQDHA